MSINSAAASRRRFAPEHGASLLGPVRAGCPEKSRPWLWMYKHWRYRPLAANLAAYPFYANISEDFERRLDEGARHLPPMTSKVKLPMVTLA
jgi:hypothetical protein